MINYTTLIIAYFVMLFLFGVIEIFLQLTFSKGKMEKTEKSFLLLIIPFYMAIYLPPLEHNLINQPIYKSTVFIGFVLFIAAITIRIVAMLTLRKNFSVAIESKPESQLITSSIYKYVRHPLYFAIIMMVTASCIIFSSWVCWLFTALTYWGGAIRIKKEEAFLNKQFDGYLQYSVKTKKIIPFIF